MDIDETEYALAKQVPADCTEITLETNYGKLRLEGALAVEVVKFIRLSLIAYAGQEY